MLYRPLSRLDRTMPVWIEAVAKPRLQRGRTGRASKRQSPVATSAAARSGAALSTPGMGDRLGVKVPWRKRWC